MSSASTDTKSLREHSWHFEDVIKKIKNGLCIQAILERMWDAGIVYMPFYWMLEKFDPEKLGAMEGDFKEYTFEELGPEDMKIIGRIKGRPPSKREEKLLKLLDDGYRCFALKYNGRIAAFMWVSPDGCHMQTYHVPMTDNEFYLADMYTLASFRGKKLAPYLRLKTQQVFAKNADTKFYSITDFFNRSSVEFKKKINATAVKKVHYFRLWSLWDHWKEIDLTQGKKTEL